MSVNKIKAHWNEQWMQVDFGTETKTCNYWISNHGRIKSVQKLSGNENLVKGAIVRGGLKVLNQKMKNGKVIAIMVHRFVAENYIDQPSDDVRYVIHKDYDKANNHQSNLGWATEEEWRVHNRNNPANKDKKRTRTYSKMNETKVRLLKKALKERKTRRKMLAKSFGISENMVYQIQSGRRWAHIKIEDDEDVKSS